MLIYIGKRLGGLILRRWKLPVSICMYNFENVFLPLSRNVVLRFDKAKMKFQLSDPDAYFVHHMSRFEHIIHKAEGFDVAQNRTLIMSQAAFHGECTNLTINPNRQYLALVAFYGGLPPNVTKDLTVKSLGQGNSLVSYSPITTTNALL